MIHKSVRSSRRTLLYSSAAFIAAAAFSFASCTPDRGRILDLLPADSRAVAVINTDKLADEVPASSLGSMSVLASGAADGIVAFVSSSNAAQYSVMIPRNSGAFASALADSGYTSVADGAFDVYSRPGSSDIVVARDGSAVWQTDISRPAEFVASQLQSASSASVKSLKGVAEYIFSEPGTVTGAVSQRAFGSAVPSSSSECWYCFSGKQADKILSIDFSMMEASGKPVDIKGVQTLSTDFLRYVPQAPGVFAAVGLTDQVDWDAAGRMVTSFAGTGVANYINALMPYLKAIDGTVALAVMPKTPENTASWLDPSAWNLFLMARMPQSQVKDALNTVVLLANMGGARISDVADGIKSIVLNDMTFYAGMVDGNFTLSTYLPDGKAQNSLAPVFSGKNGAMYSDLPATVAFPGGELQNARMNLTIQLEDAGGMIRIGFPGASVTPLEILTRAGMGRMPGF